MAEIEVRPEGVNYPELVDTLDPAVHDQEGAPEGIFAIPGSPARTFKRPSGGPRGYPTMKTVRSSTPSEIMKMASEVYMSEDTGLLDLHGVADSSKVLGILCPVGMTPLVSLASQNAYLVTRDFKIVDVAASVWPVNLDQAPDVRTSLKCPVQYGGVMGVIAGQTDPDTVIVQGTESFLAPIQDLKPLMISRELRTGG